MMHHNKVVSISQLCFNWAVKTWMLKFKSLKEHKVSWIVDILTFWDLCRVVWWKSPILKFKSQNTTKNACTSAVPCGRRVDGKQCPVLTSRQWTHCISIVPLIVMRPAAGYWNTLLQICQKANSPKDKDNHKDKYKDKGNFENAPLLLSIETLSFRYNLYLYLYYKLTRPKGVLARRQRQRQRHVQRKWQRQLQTQWQRQWQCYFLRQGQHL